MINKMQILIYSPNTPKRSCLEENDNKGRCQKGSRVAKLGVDKLGGGGGGEGTGVKKNLRSFSICFGSSNSSIRVF